MQLTTITSLLLLSPLATALPGAVPFDGPKNIANSQQDHPNGPGGRGPGGPGGAGGPGVGGPGVDGPDFDGLGPAGGRNGTHQLAKRQMGRCVPGMGKNKVKACVIGFKKYDCFNSNCDGKGSDDKCWTAANEKGKYVAKCPNNEMGYEWSWPSKDA